MNNRQFQSKCEDIMRKWRQQQEPELFLKQKDSWEVWLNVLKYLIDD